jgi:hypothetical protein
MVAARAQTTRSPDAKAPSSTPQTAERAPVRGPVPPGACPCGGGCPRCASHRSSSVHEAEAHALSTRMISAPRHGTRHAPAPAAAHRPTAHGEGRRHRQSRANAARAPPARHSKVPSGPAPTGLGGAGAGLSTAERGRFEPLLGLDLGAVRIHGGAAAETLAHEHRAHAFTYGNHIVMGRSAQHASSTARAQVLAHELVHVGQQASVAAFSRAPHRPRERAPPGVQRLPDDDTSIVPAFVSEAASAVAELGADVAESAEAAIERVAPGLLELLRGGITTRVTELLCTSLDAFVEQAFAQIGEIDFMTAIETQFKKLAADARDVVDGLKGGASKALGVVLRPLVGMARAFADPAIWVLQTISNAIDRVVSGLWNNLAKPVFDFLGKAALQALSDMASVIWGMTWPVRALGSFAWGWLKETFGLDWSGEGGVLDTLRKAATKLWEGFTKTFEPIKKPLMAIGGVLVLLSPLGPIVVLTEVIPPVWDKLKWLWENFNREDVIAWGHAILSQDVLPVIQGGVGGVATALSVATGWLAGLLVGLAAPLQEAFGAFGASSCLTAATRYLLGISAQYERLSKWAVGGFEGLVPALHAVFAALTAILQPILDFCVRVGMVAVNPWLLPTALTAAIWLLCPEDLKAAVINLVLELLIAGLDAFPTLFLGLGPLGFFVKAGILGFLKHLRFGKDVTDKVRVAAGDKIAGIAAGGGFAFVAGFSIGLLEGLLDGIIDPFRLIFLILKFVVVAFSAVGRALAPLVRAVPGVGETLEGLKLARGPPAEEQAIPDEGQLEAQARQEVKTQGATITGLADLLGAAWEWLMTSAAGIGAAIAGAILGFLALSDYELGSKLGFVAGFILLQALIIYLTAGEYAVLKGLEPAIREAVILLLKFLDLGGEILGVLGKVLAPILGPIRRGVSAAGEFIAKLPFVKAILEAIEHWIGRIMRGIEELGLFGERAAGKAAQTGERVAAEAVQTGERAVADVVAQGEKTALKEAEELAPTAARRGEQEAGETGARDVALKTEQMVEAEIFLRGFVETNDRIDTPVPALITGLFAIKAARYPWITSFEALPLPVPGHFRIEFTASPGHTLKADYSTRPVSAADIKALLTEVKRMSPDRRRALEIINLLPPGERDVLLKGLAAADPELAASALSRIGKFRNVDEFRVFIRKQPAPRAGVSPIDALLREEPGIAEQAAEAVEAGLRIEKPTVWRVTEEEIQAGRGVLKSRMDPPYWARGDSSLWNPHHVIPVEAQGHEVFNRLRNTKLGWDHNAAVNGFALPTTLDGAVASGLPVHQITPDLLRQSRELQGIAEEIPRGVITDLRGHPNWNAMVKRDLDELARSNLTDEQLRVAVYSLIDGYKGQLQSSGWIVLF